MAFAVVVLASYLATFSQASQATTLTIFLMIILGTAYLVIGIYGYAFCVASETFWHKLAYFLIQVPLGGVIVYLGKGAGFNAMLLLPLVAHSVMILTQAWMIGVNAGIMVIYVLAVVAYSNQWGDVWTGFPIFLAGQIFVLFFTQLAVGESKARADVERLVDELERANQSLREYAIQVEELAITKERNRLAREIHDGLGHYLTTIHMQLQAALAVGDSDQAQMLKALEAAQELSEAALKDVRQSVAALRFKTDEDKPLFDRISNLLKANETDGLGLDFSVIGEQRTLSAQAELTIYRAVQEGLSNTRKHADAKNLWVVLDFSNSELVRLTIQDDGQKGMSESSSGGFGLLSLQERIKLLRGRFLANRGHEGGFVIELEVPE